MLTSKFLVLAKLIDVLGGFGDDQQEVKDEEEELSRWVSGMAVWLWAVLLLAMAPAGMGLVVLFLSIAWGWTWWCWCTFRYYYMTPEL